MHATRGAVVSLNYTLIDDEGNVLDTNKNSEPFVYLHGFDNIIPGLESALEGVEEGYKSEVIVEAKDAYGEVDPEAIFPVPREHFPPGMDVSPGMKFTGETPSGPVPLVVVDVNDDEVMVDANHPLAGKRLHFDIEVVGIRAATNEELSLGYPL